MRHGLRHRCGAAGAVARACARRGRARRAAPHRQLCRPGRRARRLLADWLPGSGHALRDAPPHYLYLDDPETVAEADLRADIRVPVVAVA
ncbi:GyrI-like domain-containing protein [Xanthomonas campestris]|uniref:GyrI-like domain-containing protein n=1 Tax=Xanthomonas campestris TaxID=339 RepID=UPI002B21EAC3|nr:GyrI-like domain-containing protein [Xanthomonas campestris]MEB1125738.1 GyrI-like domain-containing protein [Xanthomonas campestris pv. campestris]MEA9472116.1 GyrI-like domain-containing protein [Xanthomonas campestris]MEA9511426.1 GyrI-like domain-containing protein [Xanthomonas campestris]MEA9520511.1 GyrI-like domain-containing protein [Xanthomonas campestris]MEA9524295.1 GyrI-like domain-containing protein [Xanthomonas campestris]